MGNRELEVLRGVNLHIKQGEMVAIMGHSGLLFLGLNQFD